MDENITVTLETDEESSANRAVLDGLIAYNTAAVGGDDYTPLNLIVRDADGTVVGGLLADTYYGWIAINILWLREDLRGAGLGARLLHRAEEEAVRRGCRNAHLDTLDFQALDFYRKYGYSVFGQLDDMPVGHTRYYLRKKLV
jgi:GNAT superfamily N-acetyltransferase